MKKQEEIAERILEAAEKRFFHYGFNKTTMAEIAADCSMSTANIYRFFEGKNAIVAELARRCFQYAENNLQTAVALPGASAGERLKTFARVLLESNYNLYAGKPRVMQAVEFITERRKDLVESHFEALRRTLVAILDCGMKNGQFAEADRDETAEYVLNALVLFCYPAFMLRCSREELSRNAEGIAALLVRGLSVD